MKDKKALDMEKIFEDVLGEKMKEFDLPPPSFTVMQTSVIDFDMENKSIITKTPILDSWLNPYGGMQGGLILGAVDNAIGPLSMLVAPANVTRLMESKYIKPITTKMEHIYILVKLVEQKRRRLFFEASVMDESCNVYVKVKCTNWIVGKMV